MNSLNAWRESNNCFGAIQNSMIFKLSFMIAISVFDILDIKLEHIFWFFMSLILDPLVYTGERYQQTIWCPAGCELDLQFEPF